MRKNVLALLVASLVSLSGCATMSSQLAAHPGFDSADAPAALRPYLDVDWQDGEWGAVLNYNRLGVAALDAGLYDVAERAFDQSLARIEAIYADNPGAKKARSVWTAEGSKDFKGEPYERAMAYYYRGLLFLREGRWGDRQVIPRRWVKESTAPISEAGNAGAYGYMWWVARSGIHVPGVIMPEGSYSARGAGGHYCFVIPSLDLVLVHRVDTDIKGREVKKHQLAPLLDKIIAARLGRDW